VPAKPIHPTHRDGAFSMLMGVSSRALTLGASVRW